MAVEALGLSTQNFRIAQDTNGRHSIQFRRSQQPFLHKNFSLFGLFMVMKLHHGSFSSFFLKTECSGLFSTHNGCEQHFVTASTYTPPPSPDSNNA